jgi:hypothetical protein
MESELDKRVRKLEAAEPIAVQAMTRVHEHVGELRSMYASTTNRINGIDLYLKAHGSRPMSKPVPEAALIIPTPVANTTINEQSQEHIHRSQLSNETVTTPILDPQQTLVKVPVGSNQKQQHPLGTLNTHMGTNAAGRTPGSVMSRSVQHQEHLHVIGTLNTGNTNDTTTNKRSVSQSNDNIIVTLRSKTRDTLTTDQQEDDLLQGYTQVIRPRYAPLFVSGVKIKNNNIDDTIQAMLNYIKRSNELINVRSLKLVKQSSGYMSAKLLIVAEYLDTLVDKDFWPKGIYCRKWIN